MNYINTKIILATLTLLFLEACLSQDRILVLQTPLISGKTSTLPSEEILKKPRRFFRTTWCPSDRINEDYPKALVDQLLARASQISKAEYFCNVTVYLEGGCASFSGYALSENELPPPANKQKPK